MKVRAILVWLVAGQRAPSAGQCRQNNNNTTVPPQPMGAGGRAVHPPDKQTNNPASTAKLSTTWTANNNAMYFGQPAANRNSCWRNYRATLGRQQQLGTFEQTTQAVGDKYRPREGCKNPGNFGNSSHSMREEWGLCLLTGILQWVFQFVSNEKGKRDLVKIRQGGDSYVSIWG